MVTWSHIEIQGSQVQPRQKSRDFSEWKSPKYKYSGEVFISRPRFDSSSPAKFDDFFRM